MNNVLADLKPLLTPLDRLAPLPGNPRQGDVNAVADSLKTFGQHKPIVVRRTGKNAKGHDTGVVLAGNHTLRAATQLKWDAIAVVWTDDDELFAKARALADNKTAELGSSDEVLLGTMLADIAAKPELLAVVAFSDKELQRLLTKAVATDSDEFPEYDETSADQVKMLSCPQCECEFPA